MNRVILGPEYFPSPDIGRPISGAQIFVGKPDLDPEVVINQKQLSVLQEDTTIVQVSQPVLTGAGGVPIHLGSPVTILVEGDYALKVLNSSGSQIYYVPSTQDSNLSTISVDDMLGLINISGQSDGDTADMLGYFVTFPQSEFHGGGNFAWQASLDKSLANGGAIIDPDNIGAFDGTVSTRDAFLTAQGGGVGLGCWVRSDTTPVNVKMFGAVGDDSTDDTNAIQATVDSGVQNIYMPESIYIVSGEININPAQTTTTRLGQSIYGDGQYKTIIESTSLTANVFRFEPNDTAVQEMIFNCGISSLTVRNAGLDSVGAAVNMFQCSNFVLKDFGAELYQTAILIEGGQLNTLQNFHITCFDRSSIIVEAAMLSFKAALKNDAVTYQLPFTTSVSDFGLQSNGKVESCLRMSAADGVNFVNGYLSFAESQIVELESDVANNNILSVNFSNCYFDGVSSCPRGINVPDDATSNSVNVVSFDNCIFGQYTGSCVVVGNSIGFLRFDTCRFINSPENGINVNGSNTSTLSVSDCTFSNVATGAGNEGIRVSVIKHFNISDNNFEALTGSGSFAIQIEGAAENGNIVGNIIAANCDGTIANAGVYSGEYVEHSNCYTRLTYTNTDTTPEVAGVEVFTITNSGGITITNFSGGVHKQVLTLFFTDSNTTVQDNADVVLAGGADFTSSADDTMQLIFITDTWYELTRSVN